MNSSLPFSPGEIESLTTRVRGYDQLSDQARSELVITLLTRLEQLARSQEHMTVLLNESSEMSLKHKLEDLDLINTLVLSLNEGVSLHSLLDKLFVGIRSIFDNHSTVVYLLSDDGNYLEMFQLSIPGEMVNLIEKVIRMKIPTTRIHLHPDSLYFKTLQSGKPQLHNDTESIMTLMYENTDNNMLRKLVPAVLKILKINSVITVPLTANGETLGLIDIDRDKPFSQDEVERVGHLSGLVTAIIKQKRIEERMMASLNEKELLLKEVHHRVKNNLQMISSLLSLQVQSLKHPVFVDKLKQCQNRIQAISLVHTKLYRSGNVARIHMKEYFDDLLPYIQGMFPAAASIQTVVDIDPVELTLDRAIPLGLIINELYTNAFKHAFHNHPEGKIRVTFKQRDPHFVLSIQDDGCGIPGAIHPEKVQTMGLMIVSSLVEQLNGTLAISNDQGTEITATFPLV